MVRQALLAYPYDTEQTRQLVSAVRNEFYDSPSGDHVP